MRKLIGALALAPLALAASPALAQTNSVWDATGDFLASYTGPQNGDLDVTSFSVSYDSVANMFTLGATFAGAIDPTGGALYAIGVNTGTGVIAPFASIGQPNVRFNQVIAVRADGTGSIGATALASSAIAIVGNILTVKVDAGLLPTTGFDAWHYGFNLWPRLPGGPLSNIADFSPENRTLSAVPEPASWGMLMLGFGAIGGAMRFRRRSTRVAFG